MKRSALISLPFIFLILLGDGFQIDLVLFKIGLTQLSIVIVFIYSFIYIKPSQNIIHFSSPSLYILFILCVIYLLIGIVNGNSLNDIKEDLIGIVYMFMIYYCVMKLSAEEIGLLWNILIIASIISVIKILLVNYINYEINWANDWQTRKDYLPGLNWYRIVLRGGDAYLSFTYLTLFAYLIYNRNKYSLVIVLILVLLFVGFGIFISLSRSSYIGIFVGTILIVYFSKYMNKTKNNYRILFITIASIIGLIVIVATNEIFNLQEIYVNRITTYDESGGALDWRSEENEIVYAKVKRSYFLGSGFGAYYFIEGSLSDKEDGRSMYTHNVFTWVLLKMGLPGILILLLLNYEYSKKYYFIMKFTVRPDRNIVLMTILFTCFINLFIISLTTNKYFMISGAMFLGLFFAYTNTIYSGIELYENRN